MSNASEAKSSSPPLVSASPSNCEKSCNDGKQTSETHPQVSVSVVDNYPPSSSLSATQPAPSPFEENENENDIKSEKENENAKADSQQTLFNASSAVQPIHPLHSTL